MEKLLGMDVRARMHDADGRGRHDLGTREQASSKPTRYDCFVRRRGLQTTEAKECEDAPLEQDQRPSLTVE